MIRNLLSSLMIVGVPILLVAILFRFFPPRHINGLYGYRTSSSMKSEETWHWANRFSANGLVIVGVLTTLLQVMDVRFFQRAPVEINAVVVMFVGIIAVIALTEWRLHRLFPPKQ